MNKNQNRVAEKRPRATPVDTQLPNMKQKPLWRGVWAAIQTHQEVGVLLVPRAEGGRRVPWVLIHALIVLGLRGVVVLVVVRRHRLGRRRLGVPLGVHAPAIC